MKNLDIKGALVKSAASAAGAAGSTFINKIGFLKEKSGLIRGAVKLALAAFLPALVKDKKTKEVAQAAANGVAAVGGLEIANHFTSGKFAVSGVDHNIFGTEEIPASYILDEQYYNPGEDGTDSVATDSNVI